MKTNIEHILMVTFFTVGIIWTGYQLVRAVRSDIAKNQTA